MLKSGNDPVVRMRINQGQRELLLVLYAMNRTLKVYWWNEIPNFGDGMNPLFIRELFGVNVERAELEEADLTASGSVIQWITPIESERIAPIMVWGSGFIFGGEPAPDGSGVEYSAVRGHRSAAFAGLDPANVVCGDPGLLADRVIRRPSARYPLGVVPHLNHRKDLTLLALIERCNARYIDVCASPEAVIEEIAACDFIFSSSLHGLIVADSYGIPNCWITTSPEPFGGRWKFDDYYSNWPELSIDPLQITDSVDFRTVSAEAASAYSRRGLESMKDQLYDVFPAHP